MSAHDRWLANYHRGTTHVWCSNPKCANHADGIEVEWETEYGQSAYTTHEECPICNSDWLEDQPDEDEDDETPPTTPCKPL
jgi:hypothetical protein